MRFVALPEALQHPAASVSASGMQVTGTAGSMRTVLDPVADACPRETVWALEQFLLRGARRSATSVPASRHSAASSRRPRWRTARRREPRAGTGPGPVVETLGLARPAGDWAVIRSGARQAHVLADALEDAARGIGSPAPGAWEGRAASAFEATARRGQQEVLEAAG